jgi:hypothetical protein
VGDRRQLRRTPGGRVGATLSSLDGLAAAGSVLRGLVGSTWYVLVASFGLVGVVVLLLLRELWQRRRDRVLSPSVLTAGLLLSALAGLLLVSALWLVEPVRPDHHVYGRYVEPVLPPLLVAGVGPPGAPAAAAAGRAALWPIAALHAAVAVLVSRISFTGSSRAAGAAPDLPSSRWTRPRGGRRRPAPSRRPGAVLLLRTSGRGRFAVAGPARDCFVPVTAFTQLRLVDVAIAPSTAALAGPTRGRSSARSTTRCYDTAHFDRVSIKVVHHYLPGTRLVPSTRRRPAPPTSLVLSSGDWPAEHPDRPAEAVWRAIPGREPGHLAARGLGAPGGLVAEAVEEAAEHPALPGSGARWAAPSHGAARPASQ